jgi:AcrR family transcriptional regulator
VDEGNPKKQGHVYGAHRERQRRRILDAAARLFDERGIDRVTVAEIVAAAGIRAATLYGYFPNKDEIVWALVGEAIDAATAEARAALEAGPGSAFEQIRTLFGVFEQELRKHPARVRFMAQFDAMYAREWTVDRLLKLEGEFGREGFLGLAEVIRQGTADGSLRPDLDPDLTMHAVMNCVIGTQRRLASLGSRVEQEYGRGVDEMFHEAVEVVLMGLRAW